MPGRPSADENDPFSQIVTQVGDHLNLWYVHFDKDLELEEADVPDADVEADAANVAIVDSKSKEKLTAPLKWGIKLLVSWKVGKNNDKLVLIGLGYESRTKMFHGELILADNPVVMNPRLPDYDHRLALPQSVLEAQGITVDTTHPISDLIPPSISLWDLFNDSGDPPKELKSIPFNIFLAELSYQTTVGKTPADKTSTMSFAMTIRKDAPQDPLDGDEAPTGFVWEEISVLASRMAGKNPETGQAMKMTSMHISSQIKLKPKTMLDPPIPEAVLDVALSYDNLNGDKDWLLEGSLQHLSVALLADCFFDETCKSGAMEVLGRLNLSSMKVLYTYSQGKASSFLITAIINLGGLELDLSYQYVSTKALLKDGKSAAQLRWRDKPPNAELKPITPTSETNWAFEAYLRVTDQEATIASIADSIVPGKGQELPDFVGGIKISAKGDPLNAPIK